VQWLAETGEPVQTSDWENPQRYRLCMMMSANNQRLAVLINGDRRAVAFTLPAREGYEWRAALEAGRKNAVEAAFKVDGHSVAFLHETPM
jgi:glycogen operon protein